MVRYSEPPVLLHDVIEDLDAVVRLLEAQAPYPPLGGWYSPGADPHARTRPMWFQKDWVHDDFAAAGSDLFLLHPGYLEAARQFYGAEVVEPHSVYVNLMTSIADGGPAHTDNPRFHGRDRTNTPMWVLRAMLWSGLFDRYEILQATAIWWMNDVEGGGALLLARRPRPPAPGARGGDGEHRAVRRQPRHVPPGRPDRTVRRGTPSSPRAPSSRRRATAPATGP